MFNIPIKALMDGYPQYHIVNMLSANWLIEQLKLKVLTVVLTVSLIINEINGHTIYAPGI